MTTESNNSVIDYRRQLSNMLDDLKKVRDFAAELKLQETAEHAGQTHARIESSFFTVAVVGEFNRGKSTLINALLGNRILPDSILPCSATLNRVTYGPTPSAKILYREKEGQPERSEDIPIEELINFVTKLTPESEVKAADIKEATVYYPTPYCREQADIIDTPGLNDDEAMTSVTLSVIPNVDAAIMIVLAQSPFAGTEGDFLNRRMLMSDIGRVLFVVNRIDEIDAEDRERLYEHIRQRIRKSVENRAKEIFGDEEDKKEEYTRFVKRVGEPKVFGVSAKQALKAKISGNQALLEESGFVRFEKALERFLTVEKGNITIQVLADCTASTAMKILLQVGIQEGGLKMEAEDFGALYQSSMEKLRQLRANYDAEIKEIDGAKERTYNYSSLILNSLEDEIRASVEQIIDAEKIAPQEIEKANIKQTQNNLAQKVSAGIQDVVRKLGEKTQIEIEMELRSEVNRLQGFAGEVRTAMSRIEFDFQNSVTVEDPTKTSDIVVSTAISSIGFYVGGLLTGYKEAGVKGAVVGGTAGMVSGTVAVFSSFLLVASLGLPLAWPVTIPIIIAGGVLSAFSGKWAARKAFPEDKVDKFKASYKEAVREKLVNEVGNKKYDFLRQLQQQVDTTFEALKRHVHVELGSQIDQTQKTLEDLRGKQARSQTEREIELKHLAAVRQETEKIQGIALSKSRDLQEITSV